MKPRLLVLNVALLAGLAASIWFGYGQWKETQEARRRVLEAKVAHVNAPQLPGAPKPPAPDAIRYVDVATKDLFSKDRNPTVIIEQTAEEKPKVMPSLPVIYGVLGLPSGTKALMAERAGLSSKPVHAGDTIGEFRIAALDPRNVTLVWEGKEIRKAVDDLMDRNSRGDGPAAAANGPGAPPPGAMMNPQMNQPGAQPQPGNPPPPPPQAASGPFGVEIGAAGHSERACRPGDTAPAGTVADGYRKVLTSTPFGTTCRWVQAQ